MYSLTLLLAGLCLAVVVCGSPNHRVKKYADFKAQAIEILKGTPLIDGLVTQDNMI